MIKEKRSQPFEKAITSEILTHEANGHCIFYRSLLFFVVFYKGNLKSIGALFIHGFDCIAVRTVHCLLKISMCKFAQCDKINCKVS